MVEIEAEAEPAAVFEPIVGWIGHIDWLVWKALDKSDIETSVELGDTVQYEVDSVQVTSYLKCDTGKNALIGCDFGIVV